MQRFVHHRLPTCTHVYMHTHTHTHTHTHKPAVFLLVRTSLTPSSYLPPPFPPDNTSSCTSVPTDPGPAGPSSAGGIAQYASERVYGWLHQWEQAVAETKGLSTGYYATSTPPFCPCYTLPPTFPCILPPSLPCVHCPTPPSFSLSLSLPCIHLHQLALAVWTSQLRWGQLVQLWSPDQHQSQCYDRLVAYREHTWRR